MERFLSGNALKFSYILEKELRVACDNCFFMVVPFYCIIGQDALQFMH